MPPTLISIFIPIASAGIIGLVVWVWTLWISHNNHKLHVAESYAKKPEIESINTKLDTLRIYMESQFRELFIAVSTLKGKNGNGNGDKAEHR